MGEILPQEVELGDDEGLSLGKLRTGRAQARES